MHEGVFRAVGTRELTQEEEAQINPNQLYTCNNMNFNMPKPNEAPISLKNFLFALLFFMLIIFSFDFSIVYSNQKYEAKLDRERCKKDYDENECRNLSSGDGNRLKEKCLAYEKCIRSNQVYFFKALIEYLKICILNIFGGLGFIKSLAIVCAVTFVILKAR